jgi:hypothetical protein
MANGMVKMERQSSVFLLPGAPTKLRRLEMRLQTINPEMTGLQTHEIYTILKKFED